MVRKLSMVLAAGALLWSAACDDGDADGDADADADGDTDIDVDADSDSDECPMNSGPPCTCDRPFAGACDDGSPCLGVRNLGSEELGYCAPRCSCDDYDQPCGASGYAAEARCILASEWPIAEETVCNCVLVDCDDAADCPPGQECRQITGSQGPYEGVDINICYP